MTISLKIICVLTGVFSLLALGCRQEATSRLGVGAANPSNSPIADGETRFPPGPTRPAPTIQLEPDDLTTATGQTPLQVIVSNLGAPVGPDLLGQIARAVTLKTWPNMVDVPITVSKIVDATGTSDQDEFAHIYFSTSNPLADRWYALSVLSLPAGAKWTKFANVLTLKDGSRVSRFRPGSDPVVAGIRVYAKDSSKEVVYVDFSEHVTGDVKLVELSYVGGGSIDCQTTSGNGAIPTSGTAAANSGMTPTAGASGSTSVGSIQLICINPIDFDRQLQLSIQPGIVSTSGPPLNNGDSVRVVAGPVDWIDWDDQGKLFRPTGP
jgi:hypothetical protein